MMEALWKLETKGVGHRWKYKRKLLTHIKAHKVINTINVVNVKLCIEACLPFPPLFH